MLVSSPPRGGLARLPPLSETDDEEPWCELARNDCSKGFNSRSKFDRIALAAATGRIEGRCGVGEGAFSSRSAGSMSGNSEVRSGVHVRVRVVEANALKDGGILARTSGDGEVEGVAEGEQISFDIIEGR